MGRYYYGDIEGKFWFAVQPSDAADRFGGYYHLSYDFDEDTLPTVEEELEKILNNLGEYKKKMDDYFEERCAKNSGYTPEELAEVLGVSLEKCEGLLRDYADYGLGIKIRDAIKEHGSCQFDAEC